MFFILKKCIVCLSQHNFNADFSSSMISIMQLLTKSKMFGRQEDIKFMIELRCDGTTHKCIYASVCPCVREIL